MSADSGCSKVNDTTDYDDASTPTEAEDDPETFGDCDSPDHISKEAWDSESEEENSDKEGCKFWCKGRVRLSPLFCHIHSGIGSMVDPNPISITAIDTVLYRPSLLVRIPQREGTLYPIAVADAVGRYIGGGKNAEAA